MRESGAGNLKWNKFDRKKALAYEREVLGRFDKTADQ